MTQAQLRRFARHPAPRAERVRTGNDRILWLGDPDRQPLHQTESQRTASELIAAEVAFSDTQTRYVSARRAVGEELRLYGPAGQHGRGYLVTQGELETAEAIRDHAMRHVEELRRQLHETRRQEQRTDAAGAAVGRAGVRAEVRRLGAAAEPAPSLFGRLLRVAAGR